MEVKQVSYGRREYWPKIRHDGKIEGIAVSAYGTKEHRGKLMLSIYLFVTAQTGRQFKTYRVPVIREYISDAGPAYQKQRLEFMIAVVETQQEALFHQAAPMSLRP